MIPLVDYLGDRLSEALEGTFGEEGDRYGGEAHHDEDIDRNQAHQIQEQSEHRRNHHRQRIDYVRAGDETGPLLRGGRALQQRVSALEIESPNVNYQGPRRRFQEDDEAPREPKNKGGPTKGTKQAPVDLTGEDDESNNNTTDTSNDTHAPDAGGISAPGPTDDTETVRASEGDSPGDAYERT